MIWFNEVSLEQLNRSPVATMVSHLNIKFIKIETNCLQATMPVDERTKQPFGLLHGGASCVLGETLGSVASNLVIDQKASFAVGQSLTAHHIKSTTDGLVVGICRPLHLGRSSHLWDIEIYNNEELSKLLCRVTLTTAIRPKIK